MVEQTRASCAPSCIVEMPKFPSRYSLFLWECCGEELVCGILSAGLADGTALLFGITHTSWWSPHSAFTAGSR